MAGARGSYAEAVKLLTASLAEPGHSDSVRANVLVHRANSYLGRGMTRRAISDGRSAIALSGDSLDAYLVVARGEQKRGKTTQAIQALHDGLRAASHGSSVSAILSI